MSGCCFALIAGFVACHRGCSHMCEFECYLAPTYPSMTAAGLWFPNTPVPLAQPHRDRLDCDGISCNYCRGIMLFQAASLEGGPPPAPSTPIPTQPSDSVAGSGAAAAAATTPPLDAGSSTSASAGSGTGATGSTQTGSGIQGQTANTGISVSRPASSTAGTVLPPHAAPWHYKYNGQVLDSSTPKQYIRGEWRTVAELYDQFQCEDVSLLTAVATHNRKEGYLIGLHVPLDLIAPIMERPRPGGALLWRHMPHTDVTPVMAAAGALLGGLNVGGRLSGAGVVNGAGSSALAVAGGGGAQVAAPVAIPTTAAAAAAIAAAGSDTGLSEGSELDGGKAGQGEGNSQGDGVAVAAAAASQHGVQKCSLPGCEVSEGWGRAGVVLLRCSGCHAAGYCTREHQKAHWREHRQLCGVGQAGAGKGI